MEKKRNLVLKFLDKNSRIVWVMISSNKILGSREKHFRTFHQLDSALGKTKNKCPKILENSQNIQKKFTTQN